jgi:malate synthase
LRPAPTGVGHRTLAGTRAAVRTVIRYRFGVLAGQGASLINGYMEDLATDRIYRLMIAQRMNHWAVAPVVDDQGNKIQHSPALISQLFDEELAQLLAELPAGAPAEVMDQYREARRISELMILRAEFDPM